MRALLRRLFTSKPKGHYPVSWGYPDVCNCGHRSVWDNNLRLHFEEQGRIGK